MTTLPLCYGAVLGDVNKEPITQKQFHDAMLTLPLPGL